MEKQSLTFNISKRNAQSWGQDRERIFANNPDISVINLCDSIAFMMLIRKGGIKVVENYNPTKLRNIFQKITSTHLHTYTVERYVNVLLKFRLCRFEQNDLVFGKIKSQTKSRNFKIEYDKGDSIKTIGRKIAEHVVSAPMRAIGYVCELKRRLNDPKSLKELKDSRKRARKLQFDIERFSNNGISYATLSSRFNVSKSYIVSIVKNCVRKGIIGKIRHVFSTCYENASRLFPNIKKFLSSIKDEYTFCFYDSIKDKLRLFNVKCNTYIYNPKNNQSLGFNTCW